MKKKDKIRENSRNSCQKTKTKKGGTNNERTTEEQAGRGADSGIDGLPHGTHDGFMYGLYPRIIAAP